MTRVYGSSVTSVRNGLPSTCPRNRIDACSETGNSGFVISVGWENVGTARSTRSVGQPTPKLDPRMQEIRVNTLTELKAAKASYTDWKNGNPGEAAKVEQYLAKIANGERPQPPALGTHRGRGIVGVLQAGAAAIGQLP